MKNGLQDYYTLIKPVKILLPLLLPLYSVITIALLCLGYILGLYHSASKVPSIEIIPDTNQTVPLIEIIDIKDAMLYAKSNTDALRLISGEEIAVLNTEGELELSIEHLGFIGPKRPVIDHKIPNWAVFVASLKGKYYYHLDERSAKRISPSGRKYFKTKEEAEENGYLPRKR